MVLGARGVRAASDVRWANPADGDWSQGANWVGGVVPNNGQPTSDATYRAIIDAAGADYTVTLNKAVTVDALTLSSASATLEHTFNTLTVLGDFDVQAGRYYLNGGTLASANIIKPWQHTGQGTLSGVTLSANLEVTGAGHLTILNNLMLNGATVSLNGTGEAPIASGGFAGSESIIGSGTVRFDGASTSARANLLLFSGGVVGPQVTVTTGTGSGQFGRDGSQPVINRGVIWAGTEGQFIRLGGLWRNEGTLRVSAGQLILGGTFKRGNIGTLEMLGGEVVIAGAMDNAGGTLTIPQEVPWRFAGFAEVTGGEIVAPAGSSLTMGSAILRDVRISGDFKVANGGMQLTGSSTIGDAHVSIEGVSPSGVSAFGNIALDSNLEVVFNGAADTMSLGVDSGSLTLGAHVLVRTGLSGGTVGSDSIDGGFGTIVNHGTISNRTAGKTLTLGAMTVTSDGLLEAVNGGTLVVNNLAGALGNVTLGAGSRLEVYGQSSSGMSNTVARNVSNGASLLLGGKWMNSAPITVDGGTLELKDRGTNSAAISVGNGSTLILGGFASLDQPSPTLGSIAVADSQVRITGRYTAAQLAGVSFTNARVTLAGAINNQVSDTLTLPSGAGVWTLEGGSISGTINGPVGTGLRAVLGTNHSALAGTLNVPLTVVGGATVDTQVLSGSPVVTNDGTFNLRNNGNLTFAGGWHNGGAVVVDASTLSLIGPAAGTLGTFETRNGGTIAFGGAFKAAELRAIQAATSGTGTLLIGGGAVVDNAGETLDLSATAHAWGVNGGTVVGGTITSTGGKALTVGGGTAVTNLDGVTLGAPVQMNGTLRITHGLKLSDAVISVAGRVGPPEWLWNGSQSISGTGEIRFDQGSNSVIMEVSSVNDAITIGPGISIRATKVGAAIGGFPLINQGAIRSETNGATIQIAGAVGPTMANDGLLEAVNRGSLSVLCPISGTGTVSVGALSTAILQRGRQGSLQVGGTVSMRTKAQGGGTLKVGELAIAGGTGAWTGKLDLADSALVVDYSGALVLARTVDQLRSGRAGGAWTGNGIMTSKAGASWDLGYAEASELLGLSGGQTATWLGQTVDATSVLVRYTVGGDANLDGVVNFTDLLALARHYNTTGDGATWGAGDFDYDGRVNFNDLLRLARNYNQALPGAVAGASVEFNADLAGVFGVAVPEPSGVGLVVGAGAVLGKRRRRRD